MSRADSILKNSSLSVTAGRKRILDIFLSANNALAHQDIEQQCSDQYDRVTIYRTLQTFLDKGIIHNIPTTDNNINLFLRTNSIDSIKYFNNKIAVYVFSL